MDSNVDESARPTVNIEIGLLLEAVNEKYGYDFRDYAKAYLKRRLLRRVKMSGLQSISELQHKVLHDAEFFELMVQDLSIHVTEMFRDPSFFRAFRKEVVPVLHTYPTVKVWHAGCSSGEEVYSMAILLKEEGLYDRALIYATDLSETILESAKNAIIPLGRMRQYSVNYQKAGGQHSLSEYYAAHHDSVVLDRGLRENIVFAAHNLVSDSVFGEMQVVICRNVVIYFTRALQRHVFETFRASLCRRGFLCLGSKETLSFWPGEDGFEQVVPGEKIFRKRK
ncbi:MAG: protein-glutamate O-methyltransferase CheR [Kiritimatiellia bacterium]|jgi:chemotaxis protein methyltransferase CheR|nr:protein-glutamate O-methyltransferase CheR [Kiritimatiellia bacterium]